MFNLDEPEVPEVTLEEVKKALDEKKDFILVDVRTEGEVARGKIPGSINLPLDKVECGIEKVIPDKDKPVYVYCLSASRSVHAVDVMVEKGYKNVFNMQYGLLGWRAKYYPVEV